MSLTHWSEIRLNNAAVRRRAAVRPDSGEPEPSRAEPFNAMYALAQVLREPAKNSFAV